jgi:dTDP-4-amino-4,6-dideoxygalactose transaminase
MRDKPIYVTEPAMPALQDFLPYLESIWAKKWLTNKGEFHQQFEQELANFLGVEHVNLFTNGTLALLLAIQALALTGEVITTPYSFVATTHALYWNGLTPVFVDIDPFSFNLDPEKIETAITEKTSAILPVHVYGVPANIERIEAIAKQYNLKVIYDAAHAFAVRENGRSILENGDISILSFHATKVFQTFEGGATVCATPELKKKIDLFKNFGFTSEVTVEGPGINAKMSEYQAAFGLLQLRGVENEIRQRRRVAKQYYDRLADVSGLSMPSIPESLNYNHAYFPVLIDAEKFGSSRDDLYSYLKQKNIYSRRYFYPLISEFAPYKLADSARAENLPVAHSVSSKILCLPIYGNLSDADVEEIVFHISTCGK